jgi:hypothetical protein
VSSIVYIDRSGIQHATNKIRSRTKRSANYSLSCQPGLSIPKGGITHLDLVRRDWAFKVCLVAESRLDRHTQDLEMEVEFVVDRDI